jgi:hypothetical protein
VFVGEMVFDGTVMVGAVCDINEEITQCRQRKQHGKQE